MDLPFVCSSVPLAFLTVDDFQCVTGLLEETNFSNAATSRWIPPGLVVYPTIEFQCDGRIQGINGIVYFEALERNNYYYSRTLALTLQVWRLNQSYYAPTGINFNVLVSPENIASGSNSSMAPFYFSNTLITSFSINLGNASIDVMAGDILGISLPLSSLYAGNIQINRIPIALADNFPIRYSNGRSECWSPTLGETLCNSIFTSFTPLLTLNFTSTSMPTGKLTTLL